MKKHFFYTLGFSLLTVFVFQASQGQNTSPYWSLAGNSNASSSSKLGTTNGINLRLYTNNAERVRILYNNGYVGIGTTAPSSRLQINAATGVSPLKAQINGATKLYMGSAGGLSVGSGTAAPSNGLYVAGNTGIGTANPASKLEVYNGVLTVTSTTSSASLVLNRANSVGGTSNQILFKDNGAVKWALGGTNIGSAGAGNFSLYNYTLGSNAMTISNSSNNIGIGTTAPEAKLHVVGSGTGIIGTSAGIGVQGNSTSGNYGVQGNSSYLGVYGIGGTYGTYGYSNNSGYGVYGVSSTDFSGNGSTGVYGTGYYGLQGKGIFGVYAVGDPYGVQGYSVSTFGYGVQGISTNYMGVYGSGAKYGVYGTAGSSGYAGYFSGAVYATNYTGSDRKLKKNIADFSSAMDIIGKLQPKSYEYRQDGNFKYMNLPEGKHYGLIAQDLEQVLPNLVKDSKFDTRLALQSQAKQEPGKAPVPTTEQQSETIDFKAVNYTELIPIIVKAMQEQQAENKALKEEIAELRQMVLDMKNGTNHTITSMSTLNQATPNPASNSVRISYSLSTGVTHAQLLFTDAVGKTIKAISLNGSGNVEVNTTSLSSGVYNYSLFIDNKIVETKKLVVAR
jgi:hypothetical protein